MLTLSSFRRLSGADTGGSHRPGVDAGAAVAPLPPPAPAAPPPLPAVSVPLPIATGTGSLPTAHAEQRRNGSGRASAPKPARARKRSEAAEEPRLVRIKRTPEIIRPDVNRLSTREHALHVLRCLRASGYKPGTKIVSRDLRAIYHDICGELNWAAAGWSGVSGIATELRKLCGGKKDTIKVWRANGVWKTERVYVLPRWSDVENVTPMPTPAARRAVA